jgi:hypothetical protein
MKSFDRFKLLDGRLQIIQKYTNGSEVIVFDEDNIITLGERQFLLSTIYTDSIDSDPVDELLIGIGGTIDPEGQFPKPEDDTVTDLYDPIANLSVTFTTDTAIPAVTFLADLDTSTANGSLLTEAGLKTASGRLFNIKTFVGIPKTNQFSLQFKWTIRLA